MADLKESRLFKSLEDQRSHWYYCHKIRFIRNQLDFHLGSSLSGQSRGYSDEVRALKCMDIGAGNGIISRSLGSIIGGRVATWDLIDSAYSRQVLGEDPIDPSIVLYGEIPEGVMYDVIIAIDVVEHVKNDTAFVIQLSRHLAADGLIVICVPAFQFLWSAHDVFLEHYRRYRRGNLLLIMREARLVVVDLGYLYVLLFPLILVIRWFSCLRSHILYRKKEYSGSDLKVYPESVNQFLNGVMGVERWLLRNQPWLGRIFGVSCLAVGVQASVSSPESSSIIS